MESNSKLYKKDQNIKFGIMLPDLFKTGNDHIIFEATVRKEKKR